MIGETGAAALTAAGLPLLKKLDVELVLISSGLLLPLDVNFASTFHSNKMAARKANQATSHPSINEHDEKKCGSAHLKS